MEHVKSGCGEEAAQGERAKGEIYVRFTSGSLQLEMRGPEAFVERWLALCLDRLTGESGEKAPVLSLTPPKGRRGRRKRATEERTILVGAADIAETATPVSEPAEGAAEEGQAAEEASGAPAAGSDAAITAGAVPSPRQLCEEAGIKKAVDLVSFAVYYHAQFLGQPPSAKDVRRVLEAIGNRTALRATSTYLSRAKARGLMYEQDRHWHLTDAGITEVRRRLGWPD